MHLLHGCDSHMLTSPQRATFALALFFPSRVSQQLSSCTVSTNTSVSNDLNRFAAFTFPAQIFLCQHCFKYPMVSLLSSLLIWLQKRAPLQTEQMQALSSPWMLHCCSPYRMSWASGKYYFRLETHLFLTCFCPA